MKKFFVFGFVALLFASGMLLSCSNGSEGSFAVMPNGGIGTITTTATTGTGSDGTTQTEPTGPTAAENTKVVVAAIKALTKSGTVKATGKLNNSSIREINAALKQLASRDKNILVTLDLSEVTELTELEEGSSLNTSCSFYECSNLAGVVLPNTLKTVGGHAFDGCSKLKNITIPDSVTTIGSGTFSGCVALEEMTLPFVGDNANPPSCSETTLFGYIFGTDSYAGAINVKQFCPDPDSFLGLREFSFYLPPFLRKVKVTGGKLLGCVFYNCSLLTDISIGSGVTSIGSGAFMTCSGLMNIKLSEGVTSIGELVFSGCKSLTSVTIPSSVTVIYGNAFDNCALINVNYSGTLSQWCKIDFLGGYGNPCTRQKKLWIQGQEITNLNIQEGVEIIKPYAFDGWKNLVTVTIPSSVTEIGCSAFSGCSALKNVTIPDSVTEIGVVAFSGCSALKNVTIPASVTKIGIQAFEWCSALENVTIPDSVTEIGGGAFHACDALKNVTFSDTKNWYYKTLIMAPYTFSDGTAIDSASLADPATAATYLKNSNKYLYKL